MPSETSASSVLERASRALAAGSWAEARELFESALSLEESGAALMGLALARWWLKEPMEALALEERAFHVFRSAGESEQAVGAVIYLCLGQNMTFGNTAAARGWLEEGTRLVEDHQLAPLAGWMHVCRAVTEHDDGDMIAAEKWARAALVSAAELGDRDLDVCARSELGAALVEQGRIAEGLPLLDGSMAGALSSDVESLDSVVMASCRTISACARAGDLRRARQWIRASESFNQRYGSPHLHTTCRVYYGQLLFLAGRWPEAEAELLAALEVGDRAEPLLQANARALLAELRLAQGRVEEAERLLTGHEERVVVLPARAALLIERGDAAYAAELLRRKVGLAHGGLMVEVRLWALLVEAELARGRVESAREAADELATLAATVAVPWVAAQAARCHGLVLSAEGNPQSAAVLEDALSAYSELDLPYDVARCRLAIARRPGAAPAAAAADAQLAREALERIGARAQADQAAALLRSWGVRSARRGPNATEDLTGREREILALLGEGLSNRDIAGRLFISPKTVEHHVGRILAKLGLSRRSEAAVWALRHPGAE